MLPPPEITPALKRYMGGGKMADNPNYVRPDGTTATNPAAVVDTATNPAVTVNTAVEPATKSAAAVNTAVG